MPQPHQLLSLVIGFGLICIASERVGLWGRRSKLPLITGFLATGILAGPYVLGLVTLDTVRALGFVDQVSLAVIAFAAGNELYLKELRSRMRAILTISAVQLLTTGVLGGLAVFLLADFVPFLAPLPTMARVAVALLAGAILVARSPSSAIAIVNELRARGPFTKTMLGITMLMDIAVIVVFACCFSVAQSLLSGTPLSAGSIGLLGVELLVSVGTGAAIGWLMHQFLGHAANGTLRDAVVLVLGYAVFAGADEVRHLAMDQWGAHFHPEPLLICMVASFVVTNYTNSRQGLTHLLHRLSPPIYVLFFTLTGASLELHVLPTTWHIALGLCAVRLAGIWLGNGLGGRLCDEPALHNRLGWMAHATQAGVALGLAKNVATAFPTWGGQFATTIVALIVVNQVIGPPMLKWVIAKVGEDRSRGETAAFDGLRDALIFGLEGQSIALARSLVAGGWTVKIACPVARSPHVIEEIGVRTEPIGALDAETLDRLGAAGAEAIVGLMSDEQNLQLCELAFQRYGTKVLVVRLGDRAFADRFAELGALVIDPRRAVSGLLDRAVRSPTTAAMVLGVERSQDMIDVDVGNPDVADLAVRDLRLPLDVAVLYVHRTGSMIPAKGTTLLRAGDRLTISGPTEALQQAAHKLEG